MRSASRLRVWFGIFAAVAAATAGAVAPGLYRTVVLGSAFLAQRLCGDVFVSKRDPDAVLAEDLSGPGYEPLRFFQPSVDRERRLFTASAGKSPFSEKALAARTLSARARASFAMRTQICSPQLRLRTSMRCGQMGNGSILRRVRARRHGGLRRVKAPPGFRLAL